MKTAEILSLLRGVKKRNTRWMALCPVHQEKTPSLSLKETPEGDTLAVCFGCGADAYKIASALGLTINDFFRDGKANGKGHKAPRYIIPQKEEPIEDWTHAVTELQKDNDSVGFADACAKLKLPEKAVKLIGGCWSNRHKALAFPMFHVALGSYTPFGIRLRANDGRKWAVLGSHNGIFIPSSMPQTDLWITEGPTDTAALLSLGCYTIGRASCNTCIEYCVAFAKTAKAQRVIIVSDQDVPGSQGARELARAMTIPTKVIIPPAKDARQWITGGASRMDVDKFAANFSFRLWT